ncbi:MAG: DNA repair protein RadC [Chitinophagaceae bacterium]|nr:DNA repair protein RadC [Chitinophagaceae bacterium]
MKTTKALSTIKEWSEEDRPREKLLLEGPPALSNTELLAILINTGTAQRTAIDIAQELLSQCGNNLVELGKQDLRQLQQVKGIGSKKAITVLAALELGKRRQKANSLEHPRLDTSVKVFEVLQPYFMDKKWEEFYVLYMNHANKLIYIHLLHSGGVASVQIDVRLIFKKAFEFPAVTRMIVAHNHPSGDLKPSEADKNVTRRIRDLSALFEIKLADHLIIHENTYYSFHDEGLL